MTIVFISVKQMIAKKQFRSVIRASKWVFRPENGMKKHEKPHGLKFFEGFSWSFLNIFLRKNVSLTYSKLPFFKLKKNFYQVLTKSPITFLTPRNCFVLLFSCLLSRSPFFFLHLPAHTHAPVRENCETEWSNARGQGPPLKFSLSSRMSNSFNETSNFFVRTRLICIIYTVYNILYIIDYVHRIHSL